MKPIRLVLFTASIIILQLLTANAGGCPGCVADTSGACSGFLGAVCPSTGPQATTGTNYQADFTANIIAGIDTNLPVVGNVTLQVSEARIVGVSGLPQGLSWDCDIPNCTYNPQLNDPVSQYHCLRVCGVPCGAPGTYTVTVDFEYDVDVPFVGNQTVPNSINFEIPVASAVGALEITTPSSYLCPNGAGSSLQLDATAGFTSYDWSTGDTTSSLTVSTPATYSVTATDNNGCTQDASAEIFNLNASGSADQIICENQVTRIGASGGDTYSWVPSTGLSDPSVANPVVYHLTSSTTYVVTVGNSNCTSTDTVEVTVDNTNCSGTCSGTCTVNSSGCTGSTPKVCQTTLPTLTAGNNYQEGFTFYFPEKVQSGDVIQYIDIPDIDIPGVGNLQDFIPLLPNTDLDVDTVSITVEGLPLGVQWECDQIGNNCTYYPSLIPSVTQYGCIQICGTAVCAEAGQIEISVVGNFAVELPLPFEVPGVGNTFDVQFPMTVILPVNSVNGTMAISSSNSTNIITSGETVTLTATTGFVSYRWSDNSTGESISVTTPGSYSVTVEDDNGCEQVETFDLSAPNGINDQALIEMSVFPNPNDGQFEIQFSLSSAQEVSIQLLAIDGKELSNEVVEVFAGLNAYGFNRLNLETGVYIVKVLTDEGFGVKRISVL